MMSKHQSSEELSIVSNLLAGSCAGFTARIISAPFDVVKIRFQLQFEKDVNNQKYKSTLNALRTIVKEEGIWSLWKGNTSALYLWILYGTVQFSSYKFLKSWGLQQPNFISTIPIPQTSVSHDQIWKSFVLFSSGATAGIISTTVTYPFDIMRTQFAIQGKQKVFTNMFTFLRETINSNGVRGLYRGLPTALAGIVPYMGLNFTFYEAAKDLLATFAKNDSGSGTTVLSVAMSSGVCGAISGGASKLIIFPFDTIKRRLQTSILLSTVPGVGHPPLYSSAWACMRLTIKNEGIRGLYKGVVPTIVKSVVSTAVTFATYESVKDLILGETSSQGQEYKSQTRKVSNESAFVDEDATAV